MEVAKSRFQTKPWRSHTEFPEAFECAGEIWRWVYMAILPRHPLCSQYANWVYNLRQRAPNYTIMPVQLWSVQYFEELAGQGSAWSAVDFLEAHGKPFHVRLLAMSLGHSSDVRAAGIGQGHEDYFWYGPMRRATRAENALTGANRAHYPTNARWANSDSRDHSASSNERR